MAELIEAWQIVLGLVIGVPLAYARWVAPTIKFRTEMLVWKATVDQRLDHGDDKFDRLCEKIDSVEARIANLELQSMKTNTLLEKAVFRGVGE